MDKREATAAVRANYRSVLICHADDPLNYTGMARWLAACSHLAGIVVIRENGDRKWQRLRREWRRSGTFGLLDVFLFRLYYRLRHARRDAQWERELLEKLSTRYAPVAADVPILYTVDPNSDEVRAFIEAQRCDVAIARCKTLLKRSIYSAPRCGTLVMHPGICPQYRNAHGCFWALSRRDLANVGMTLLKVDDGIDTGPVYGYFRATFDEWRDSHHVIQCRTVFDNLTMIERSIESYVNGSATAVDVGRRPSQVWGQPRLTPYLYWKWCAFSDSRRQRDTAVLLYHDVTPAGQQDASGFGGDGAGEYKLDSARFDAHLAALRQAFPDGPHTLDTNTPPTGLMLSFDDGGRSAITEIAPRLEALGWRGIFFITTRYIGTPGFLTVAEIRELNRRGHVIGSHSASHPRRMSALSDAQIYCEWSESVTVLNQILGQPVRIASVPGGYSSRRVYDAAARAGIRILMTSEPRARSVRYGDLTLLGRFSIHHNTSAATAVALAGGSRLRQWRQWLRWNGLKLAKHSLGAAYPVVREALLGVRHTKTGIGI